MTKIELIEDCIRFITKDIGVMSKERSFLRNLLIQMEIYQGLCSYKYVSIQRNNIQDCDIQRVMDFISRRGIVSLSDLIQEFLMNIDEPELTIIIETLISAKYIQYNGNLIKLEGEIDNDRNTKVIRNNNQS